MDSDIPTDPSDYTDYSDQDTYSDDNNSNNDISVEVKVKPESYDDFSDEYSDEYSDDDSTYSYSSEPSYSDDDYLPNDIKFESGFSISTHNNNNSNNNNNNKHIMKLEPNDINYKLESIYSLSMTPSSSSSNTANIKNRKKCIKKQFEKEAFMNLLKCEHCNDTFQYHTLYRKHMNEIHKIEKPYICKKQNCQKTYANKAGLDTHIERDHEKIRKFKCNVCPNRTFYDKVSFKIHQRSHAKNNVLEPIHCEHCNDIFTSHAKYKRHMNETHNIPRPYICDLCPKDKKKTYKDKSGLNTHIQRYHEKIRKFKCHLCPKAFYGKFKLQRHQRVHDGLKPFKCNLCELRFSQNCSRKQHIIAVHLKEKNWPCSYCEKRFGSSTGMKSHLAAVHNDAKYARFECKTCHKRWYEKGHYYKHIDTAHRPKDPIKEKIRRGECIYPQCNKKYTGKNPAESVKYHLVHTHKDRNYAHYQCKKCKKLFYDKTSHRKHMENRHN